MTTSTPYTIEFDDSPEKKPLKNSFFSDKFANAEAFKEEILKKSTIFAEDYLECAQLFNKEKIFHEAKKLTKKGLKSKSLKNSTVKELKSLLKELEKKEDMSSSETPLVFKSALSRRDLMRRMSIAVKNPEQPETNIKEEAKLILSLMKKMENSSYLSKEFNPVYLISNKWMTLWKAFTGFLELTGEKLHNIEGLVNKEEAPPYIDNADLIDGSVRLLIDTSIHKSYTNFMLKDDLIENENFIFVSKQIWDFFKEKYGNSDELKRYVICTNDEKNTCIVEVKLKKVNSN